MKILFWMFYCQIEFLMQIGTFLATLTFNLLKMSLNQEENKASKLCL